MPSDNEREFGKFLEKYRVQGEAQIVEGRFIIDSFNIDECAKFGITSNVADYRKEDNIVAIAIHSDSCIIPGSVPTGFRTKYGEWHFDGLCLAIKGTYQTKDYVARIFLPVV